MRILVLFVFLTEPSYCFAGFRDLSGDDLYKHENKGKVKMNRPKVYKRKRKAKKTKGDNTFLLKKLIDEDRKLAEILKRQERNVIYRKKDSKIMALTRIRGIVLNSILAMNIKPSKFIIRIGSGDEFLEGGEIRCVGYSFQKRVPAHCNLLVLDEEEYEVDIDIWDLDGAEGIIADYFYSGEEKSFLTSTFSSFFQGVLDAAKDRINTPFGMVGKNNAKNKVLNGLVGVASNVGAKVKGSAEKNMTISYINSGKEVIIFFNKSLILEKGSDK